ncbi:MAG: cytochrome-c peroxidase [Calditrichales bacterium]|nr:MAG: cytochrome-c peroxidase [Calditrichales bacterium]
MKNFFVFASILIFLLPLFLQAQTSEPVPLTKVGVHSLGPQKLDNLPPVLVPADNPQTSLKIDLGKKLYFDTRLSKDNTISCATCHDPAKGWSDDGPTSVGIAEQKGGRRAPPVSNAAYFPLQFWDGRAPSLEEQAKGPIENPIEMGNTHTEMLRTVGDIAGYVDEFETVFGTREITTDLVAKAIASYERTVVTTDSPFDRFVRGDNDALTEEEKMGLEIFNGKGHCTSCHWGGLFSDGRFHNIGVPTKAGQAPDAGRHDVTKDPADMGKFKTPTVRDAALRAPYLHDGSEKSLEDLVELYNLGGRADDPNLDPLIVPLGLSDAEKKALVSFMKRAMTSLNPEVADVKPVPSSEFPR